MKIKDLYRLYLNSRGISTDTRQDLNKTIFFALKGENFDANDFALDALNKGAAYAVADKKISA